MVRATRNRSILAVIVLYEMEAGASPAYTSLRGILAANPQAGEAIDLLIWDNTPHEQRRPPDLDGLYLTDPSNPGLAKSYNEALKIASDRGCPWLLLLDQDTTPTVEYVAELLTATSRELENPEVVAMVPKLVNRGVLASPHSATGLRRRAPSVAEDFTGIGIGKLFVFNSGSTLRVAALEAIGGFPLNYPLDFLDHATFSKLQMRGGRIYVLRSILIHNLSTNNYGAHDQRLAIRHMSKIDSELRYVKEFGTSGELWLLRLRLIRSGVGHLFRRTSWQHSCRLFKGAFRI